MSLVRVALSVLTAVTLWATPAGACSKVGLYVGLPDSDLFFVGRGTEETPVAGAGTVEYGTRGGHYGPARQPGDPIRGQRILVDRIGGPAAGSLRGRTAELVVVPWDYDGGCRPVAWGGSAVWVEPGVPKFFLATLRPSEHWVDGIPTVDIHNPGGNPYRGEAVSADELFGLYQALPSRAEMLDGWEASLERARHWAEVNPELGAREPARRLLGAAARSIRLEQRRRADHPVLGTWRFTVHVAEAIYRVYARTDSHPTSAWSAAPQPHWEEDPFHVPADDGYSVRVSLGSTPADLPVTYDEQFREQVPLGYLAVTVAPESGGDGTIAWPGRIEAALLRRGVPAEPRFQALERAVFDRDTARYRAGEPPEMPGRFTRGPDGVLRVTQEYLLPDGGTVRVEGEQLSRDVVSW